MGFVNVLPSPNPLLGNDTTVCTAQSVTFDAGSIRQDAPALTDLDPG